MRKIYLLVIYLIFSLTHSLKAEEIRRWVRPGGDPSGLTELQAVDSLFIPPPEVRDAWRVLVETEQWESLWIHKGDTLPELLFGGKKSRTFKHWLTTLCAWEKVDSLQARCWTTVYYDTLESPDSLKFFEGHWSYVRFDTCNNATWLYQGFKKVVKKEQPPPPLPLPQVTQLIEPPVLKAEIKRQPLSITWIAEVSHWNNDQDPWINYGEGKIGLRFTLRSQKQWLPTFETDVWLGTRLHTVLNGEQRAWQGPLYQVQPKLSLQPNQWLYFLVADAVTLSNRGLDSNTILALSQIYLNPLRAGYFEPMLQVSGSMTDSWPRYLGDDEFPESRARYREIKGRLQIFRFGNLRLGWEDTWFGFEKTRVDSNLVVTKQLIYQSTSRPAIGGLFAQYKFPWDIYADFSVVRQHIDSEAYILQEEGIGSWIPGDVDEWRFNLVLSRGFRLDLLK